MPSRCRADWCRRRARRPGPRPGQLGGRRAVEGRRAAAALAPDAGPGRRPRDLLPQGGGRDHLRGEEVPGGPAGRRSWRWCGRISRFSVVGGSGVPARSLGTETRSPRNGQAVRGPDPLTVGHGGQTYPSPDLMMPLTRFPDHEDKRVFLSDRAVAQPAARPRGVRDRVFVAVLWLDEGAPALQELNQEFALSLIEQGGLAIVLGGAARRRRRPFSTRRRRRRPTPSGRMRPSCCGPIPTAPLDDVLFTRRRRCDAA